ncbi:hypothetical protein HK102_004312 [Quaeritorhiza haematococci]|nr:hypothetical protein HK102_004312 [Quaeritorhiza haematococci]
MFTAFQRSSTRLLKPTHSVWTGTPNVRLATAAAATAPPQPPQPRLQMYGYRSTSELSILDSFLERQVAAHMKNKKKSAFSNSSNKTNTQTILNPFATAKRGVEKVKGRKVDEDRYAALAINRAPVVNEKAKSTSNTSQSTSEAKTSTSTALSNPTTTVPRTVSPGPSSTSTFPPNQWTPMHIVKKYRQNDPTTSSFTADRQKRAFSNYTSALNPNSYLGLGMTTAPPPFRTRRSIWIKNTLATEILRQIYERYEEVLSLPDRERRMICASLFQAQLGLSDDALTRLKDVQLLTNRDGRDQVEIVFDSGEKIKKVVTCEKFLESMRKVQYEREMRRSDDYLFSSLVRNVTDVNGWRIYGKIKPGTMRREINTLLKKVENAAEAYKKKDKSEKTEKTEKESQKESVPEKKSKGGVLSRIFGM